MNYELNFTPWASDLWYLCAMETVTANTEAKFLMYLIFVVPLQGLFWLEEQTFLFLYYENIWTYYLKTQPVVSFFIGFQLKTRGSCFILSV